MLESTLPSLAPEQIKPLEQGELDALIQILTSQNKVKDLSPQWPKLLARLRLEDLSRESVKGSFKGWTLLQSLAHAVTFGHLGFWLEVDVKFQGIPLPLLVATPTKGFFKNLSVLWILTYAASKGHITPWKVIRAKHHHIPVNAFVAIQTEGPFKNMSAFWLLTLAAALGHISPDSCMPLLRDPLPYEAFTIAPTEGPHQNVSIYFLLDKIIERKKLAEEQQNQVRQEKQKRDAALMPAPLPKSKLVPPPKSVITPSPQSAIASPAQSRPVLQPPTSSLERIDLTSSPPSPSRKKQSKKRIEVQQQQAEVPQKKGRKKPSKRKPRKQVEDQGQTKPGKRARKESETPSQIPAVPPDLPPDFFSDLSLPPSIPIPPLSLNNLSPQTPLAIHPLWSAHKNSVATLPATPEAAAAQQLEKELGEFLELPLSLRND